MNILIDMDGTIVDFMAGFQLANNYWMKREDWPKGEYDLAKVMGERNCSYKALATPQFWTDLKPYKGWLDLLELCCAYGGVYFITHCGSYGGAYEGKREWLYDHGQDPNIMVAVSGNRDWLPNQWNFVIDDNQLNNSSYVVPRVWNDHQDDFLCECNGKFLDYQWNTRELDKLETALSA